MDFPRCFLIASQRCAEPGQGKKRSVPALQSAKQLPPCRLRGQCYFLFTIKNLLAPVSVRIKRGFAVLGQELQWKVGPLCTGASQSHPDTHGC